MKEEKCKKGEDTSRQEQLGIARKYTKKLQNVKLTNLAPGIDVLTKKYPVRLILCFLENLYVTCHAS